MWIKHFIKHFLDIDFGSIKKIPLSMLPSNIVGTSAFGSLAVDQAESKLYIPDVGNGLVVTLDIRTNECKQFGWVLQK